MTIPTPESLQNVLAEVSREVAEHLSSMGLGPEAVERIYQVRSVQIMAV